MAQMRNQQPDAAWGGRFLVEGAEAHTWRLAEIERFKHQEPHTLHQLNDEDLAETVSPSIGKQGPQQGQFPKLQHGTSIPDATGYSNADYDEIT